jgi:predicted amidohydrolase
MAGPDRLRVAAAQYPLDAVASLAAWADKTAAWVGEGAATGAELLVFPEYGAIEIAAAAGPDVAQSLEATLAAVADAMAEMDRMLTGLAARHRVHVLAASGPRRRGDGRFVNSARLITPDGAVAIQDKLIMTPFEVGWGIVPGDRPRVFDTRLGRLGIAICYDSEFPLLVRAMAEAGAEAVLIPTCTERLSGYHRIRAAAAARALESTIATVVAPTVGEALWSPAVDRNCGAAAILVPAEHELSMTGVIAEGVLNAPGWVVGDIDLARLRWLRSNGEMRNYADWSEQQGAAPLAGHAELVSLG